MAPLCRLGPTDWKTGNLLMPLAANFSQLHSHPKAEMSVIRNHGESFATKERFDFLPYDYRQEVKPILCKERGDCWKVLLKTWNYNSCAGQGVEPVLGKERDDCWKVLLKQGHCLVRGLDR